MAAEPACKQPFARPPLQAPLQRLTPHEALLAAQRHGRHAQLQTVAWAERRASAGRPCMPPPHTACAAQPPAAPARQTPSAGGAGPPRRGWCPGCGARGWWHSCAGRLHGKHRGQAVRKGGPVVRGGAGRRAGRRPCQHRRRPRAACRGAPQEASSAQSCWAEKGLGMMRITLVPSSSPCASWRRAGTAAWHRRPAPGGTSTCPPALPRGGTHAPSPPCGSQTCAGRGR